MNKYVSYGVSALLLLIFVAVMTSGNLVKQPFGQSDQVERFMVQLEAAISNEEWDHAEKVVESLDSAWKQVRKRVQFSVERDEIIELNRTVARLKGSVNAKDKNNALVEIYEAKEIWDDLAG